MKNYQKGGYSVGMIRLDLAQKASDSVVLVHLSLIFLALKFSNIQNLAHILVFIFIGVKKIKSTKTD
jgi:hypothetical protein